MIQADCFKGVLLVQGKILPCRSTKHVMIDPNFTTHTCVPGVGRSRCCLWVSERGSTGRHVAAFHLSGLVAGLCGPGQSSQSINQLHLESLGPTWGQQTINTEIVLVNYVLACHMMVNRVLIHARPKVNNKTKSVSHSKPNARQRLMLHILPVLLISDM